MKIDILCNDGSPIGVVYGDIYGKHGRTGVGGAELALLTMAQYWAELGYDVTLYNNPRMPPDGKFQQRAISAFRPGDARDVLIVFRSPNPLAINARGKKIWWSCDQYTVGDFRTFGSYMDEIAVISKFHAEYFERVYGLTHTTIVDLPVLIDDYSKTFEKNPKQCIFTSVPDRGLHPLLSIWPRIVSRVPDAELVITSGWSLWTGTDTSRYELPYRQLASGLKNVRYVGALLREQLVQKQLESSLFLYPCTYDELFCIACAEAQVAGAWAITSAVGALPTTNMCTVLGGYPINSHWLDDFSDFVCTRLENPSTYTGAVQNATESARNRFSTHEVNKVWQKLFT